MVMYMKRTVVIYNPEFDQPGKAGVDAALDIARSLEKGWQSMYDVAVAGNIGPDGENITEQEAKLTRQFLSGMKVLVKKVNI